MSINIIRRKLFREDANVEEGTTWCEVEIELRERDGKQELSICGTAGYTLTQSAARKEALEHWVNYFEDDRAALAQFALDHGKRTPRTAAKHVINVDGEYHGLDVHHTDGRKVYVTHSAGQIRETIARFFPEVERYFEWHLNGMTPACEHQRAFGWSNCRAHYKEGEECAQPIQHSEEITKYHEAHPPSKPGKGYGYRCRWDALSVPCPVCGYAYGSQWLHRELPAEVIAWAKGEAA